jgi:hypothetical protein
MAGLWPSEGIETAVSPLFVSAGTDGHESSGELAKRATVSLAVAIALMGCPMSVLTVRPEMAHAAPPSTSTVVIPEQKAVADAESTVVVASMRLEAARKALGIAQSQLKAAESSFNKASQEVSRAKAGFLSANDALSSVKSSKYRDASRIESATTRVGTPSRSASSLDGVVMIGLFCASLLFLSFFFL